MKNIPTFNIIARKWLPKEHKYLDGYKLPPNCNIIPYFENEDPLKKMTACAHCSTAVTYGDAYTSLEIHTYEWGMGYPVCEKCYEEELKRRELYPR